MNSSGIEPLLAQILRALFEAFELRYNAVPQGLAEVIRGISDKEQLRALLRHAIRCVSLEEFALGL